MKRFPTEKSLWKAMWINFIIFNTILVAVLLGACSPYPKRDFAENSLAAKDGYEIKIVNYKLSNSTPRMSRFDYRIDGGEEVITFHIVVDKKVVPEGRADIGAVIFDCVNPDMAFYTSYLDHVDGSLNKYAVYVQTDLSAHALLGDDGSPNGRLNLEIVKRDGLCLALSKIGGGIANSRGQFIRSNKINLKEYVEHLKD